MVKTLIIARKPENIAALAESLESNGFGVETVLAGCATTAALRCKACALIICERAVLENREVCAFLEGWNVPILWIVEEGSLPEAVRNFRMGLEDYIFSSAGTAEILARVNMLLRCTGIHMGRKLLIGELYLDADARSATVNGSEVPLTMREFDLLFGLLSEPDRAFSRRELMQKYWGGDTKTGPRSVDVYMTKLREKFADCKSFQITTMHGIGYKAVLTNAAAS